MEANLERAKVTFCESHQFCLSQLFAHFATCPRMKLTEHIIHEKLNLLGYVQLLDAHLLLLRYDTDGDSCLSYWEFADIFVPLHDEKVR